MDRVRLKMSLIQKHWKIVTFSKVVCPNVKMKMSECFYLEVFAGSGFEFGRNSVATFSHTQTEHSNILSLV
jgi:hypothetical protein